MQADLADAILASENNTMKLCDVLPTGVTVQRGPTIDGLGSTTAKPSSPPPSRSDVVQALMMSSSPTSGGLRGG